jgi:hypothetical protein
VDELAADNEVSEKVLPFTESDRMGLCKGMAAMRLSPK